MKELLGIKLYEMSDVAELLGCNIRTIQSYMKKELLKAVTISGKVFVSETSLRVFLNCGYEAVFHSSMDNTLKEPDKPKKANTEPANVPENSEQIIIELNKLIGLFGAGQKRTQDNKFQIGKLYDILLNNGINTNVIKDSVNLSLRQLRDYAKLYRETVNND